MLNETKRVGFQHLIKLLVLKIHLVEGYQLHGNDLGKHLIELSRKPVAFEFQFFNWQVQEVDVAAKEVLVDFV